MVWCSVSRAMLALALATAAQVKAAEHAGLQSPVSRRLLSCSFSCPSSYLGDGFCDPGCDNAACNYDNGDCAASPSPPSPMAACAPGCSGSDLGLSLIHI